MKLFQKLLVAPAALGLLAPLAANAAEVNINDVASYSNPGAEVTTAQFSDVVPGDWAYTALQNLSESTGCVDSAYAQNLKSGQALTRYEAAALVNACLEGGLASADADAIRLSNEFGTEMAILKGRVDGLEYKVEELSAGAFASSTKMSGGATFTVGFIDTADTAAEEAAGTTDGKLAAEYNFSLDLNTSFTEGDNLYVGLEAGNQDDLVLDSSVTGGNNVQVDAIHYSFPLGDFTVTAGALMEQDDVISAKLSDYSESFRLSAMPWGNEEDEGAGAGITYYSSNGFNGSLNFIAEGADNAATGMFTEEGIDKYTASIGYDADNWGAGIVYTDEDSVDTSTAFGVYFRPDDFPSISVVLDKLSDDGATDSSNLMIGSDYKVGPGTLSAAWQVEDDGVNDRTENNYEIYYNYPVNDSIAIQGGFFAEETGTDDTEDTQGLIVETFFSF